MLIEHVFHLVMGCDEGGLPSRNGEEVWVDVDYGVSFSAAIGEYLNGRAINRVVT